MRAACSIPYVAPQVRKPARALIVLTLLAVIAAGLAWQLESHPPSFEALLRTEAFESRPTPGRLSWNPYYAPYRPVQLARSIPALKRYPQILFERTRAALSAARH